MIQHNIPWDPTYGYDLNALLDVKAPPPPPGFEQFWRDTYERTLRIPPRPERRPIELPGFEKFDVWEVEYDTTDGVRIGGWITRPRGERPKRGVVVSHGYGARGGPDPFVNGPPAVAIFPCARGFARSKTPKYPDDVWKHVVHGIESRETYCHVGCACELFSATSALIELEPQVEGYIDYVGGSFGGGIGGLTIPWEKRFRRAFLDVPSFGHHPLRLTMQCYGSGEAVRRLYASNPGIYETLKYADSATASLFTTTPTLVAAALFDPAVPPPGQFAVHNALRCEKQLFVREASHFDWPGVAAENERLGKILDKWFE
jgi:cephalosporin-C deacetylase